MKLLFVINKKEKPETLIDLLKRTESIEEVADVLTGIRNRTIFIQLINELLNELSEEVQEKKELLQELKRIEKIEELEII